MMAVLGTDRTALESVRVGCTAEALDAITATDCAAAIWQRSFDPAVLLWLDTLDPDLLPEARVILRPEAVRSAVLNSFADWETPDVAERQRLVDDICALAERFTDLMRAPYLRLRLDVVSDNSCRRFHVDTISARLVCTYRGTGTQYGEGLGGADPTDIRTVQTGDPVVLRGTLWPCTPPSALLHRSPPIEGTSETRLLLVLDPIFDPTDEV